MPDSNPNHCANAAIELHRADGMVTVGRHPAPISPALCRFYLDHLYRVFPSAEEAYAWLVARDQYLLTHTARCITPLEALCLGEVEQATAALYIYAADHAH